jgi:hypothetical protein
VSAGQRRVPPTKREVAEFHRDYPTNYAACRTWGHGPERPYTVERPNGSNGVIEVTRICRCGRLVTRVFTAAYQRIPGATRTVYPDEPRYLALPGTGGVTKSLIAKRAVAGEVEAIEHVISGQGAQPAKRARRSKRPTKTKDR